MDGELIHPKRNAARGVLNETLPLIPPKYAGELGTQSRNARHGLNRGVLGVDVQWRYEVIACPIENQ